MKNFITFEGVDGSGKTTAIEIVSKKLKQLGYKNFVTREPGGKNLQSAEAIRQIIFKYGDIDSITELLLFEASRREHISKIIQPQLKKKNIVLCDRYIDSSYIYQGVLGKVGVEKVNHFNKLTIEEFVPELTFIFDVKPEIALKRINKTREISRFDTKPISYHQKVYKAYLKLAKTDKRFKIINANQSPEQVAQDIVNIIIKNNENSKKRK